jgi:hypothetical protein
MTGETIIYSFLSRLSRIIIPSSETFRVPGGHQDLRG